MSDQDFTFPRLDKTVFRVVALGDDSVEREYWRARSPQERLEHVEYLRRMNYGDQATARLQRVFEIAQCSWR